LRHRGSQLLKGGGGGAQAQIKAVTREGGTISGKGCLKTPGKGRGNLDGRRTRTREFDFSRASRKGGKRRCGKDLRVPCPSSSGQKRHGVAKRKRGVLTSARKENRATGKEKERRGGGSLACSQRGKVCPLHFNRGTSRKRDCFVPWEGACPPFRTKRGAFSLCL